MSNTDNIRRLAVALGDLSRDPDVDPATVRLASALVGRHLLADAPIAECHRFQLAANLLPLRRNRVNPAALRAAVSGARAAFKL